MYMDIQNIRTALIVTLSVLLVVVLWRRFKRGVLAKDMPAPLHAELINLQVQYHPARLHVVVKVPSNQTIRTNLLDGAHNPLHAWADVDMKPGESTIELALPAAADGQYHLEMCTDTQRTVRQFRLLQG
ncbi:MAG: hypothetical protein IPI00_05095 [Flavobacteriales bacterium]|nr:hypothetical protein [Flavobacteriales bacterium]MBK9535243.1 hypothetical protein [Flavobacteriales bacterium]MBP9137782.1 hypothetical protein [Flavobacteriales bacterium]HQX29394.1 hypothetical protein [Flavobacteriales bacterium]HQX38085.1 hypothetical protein [Flavobacteriales bacterium]